MNSCWWDIKLSSLISSDMGTTLIIPLVYKKLELYCLMTTIVMFSVSLTKDEIYMVQCLNMYTDLRIVSIVAMTVKDGLASPVG